MKESRVATKKRGRPSDEELLARLEHARANRAHDAEQQDRQIEKLRARVTNKRAAETRRVKRKKPLSAQEFVDELSAYVPNFGVWLRRSIENGVTDPAIKEALVAAAFGSKSAGRALGYRLP